MQTTRIGSFSLSNSLIFGFFLSRLVMEEKGEKWERLDRIFSLPVVMNEEIEFCIWGWVGICSNKSGDFCIWGYNIEGVGVSVLAEFVKGECSGMSSNGNNFCKNCFDKSELFDWWESGGM